MVRRDSVPEGSLAGFLGCVFEVWPAPGARETFKNVGGEAPHVLEGSPVPEGPARPQTRTQTIRPVCLQVASLFARFMAIGLAAREHHLGKCTRGARRILAPGSACKKAHTPKSGSCPNPINLYDLVTSMAPHPMNLQGLVTSMAPNPMNL